MALISTTVAAIFAFVAITGDASASDLLAGAMSTLVALASLAIFTEKL